MVSAIHMINPTSILKSSVIYSLMAQTTCSNNREGKDRTSKQYVIHLHHDIQQDFGHIYCLGNF